jgi:hypothetical protein
MQKQADAWQRNAPSQRPGRGILEESQRWNMPVDDDWLHAALCLAQHCAGEAPAPNFMLGTTMCVHPVPS